MTSFVVVRGAVFGRATARTEIVGFALLPVATVRTTFVPQALGAAMRIAFPEGLLAMARPTGRPR